MFEKDLKQFYWNVTKFDMICNELNVTKKVGAASLGSIDISDLNLKIPYVVEHDIENQNEVEFKKLKITNFKKLSAEDELLDLKDIFGQSLQTNYRMNLNEASCESNSSINLYFDKLNMNIQMV